MTSNRRVCTGVCRALRLLFAIPLLASLAITSAAIDWPPVTPEEQSLKDLKEQPGAAAVILERQEVADDLNNVHSTYKRIKVLTEAGRRYADVELPYDAHGYAITEISGRTIRPDGSVVPFEGKPFDKVVLKGKGIRYKVKTFTLPDVQVGSILDFHYNLRYPDNRVVAPEWSVQEGLFQKKASFKFIPFQGQGGQVYIQLPHGQIAQGIAWSNFLPAQYTPKQHTVPKADFMHKQVGYWVDLDVADVPALVDEPFMPPPDIIRWRVDFYYQVTAKVDEYWKEQGKFWSKDVESFVDKKKGIAEQVAKLTTANDNPEQKAQKLYAFVAQLENQSFIPSRPDQEDKALGLKANSGAEDVLRQRSGDHDDLNRLLLAMLRAAGIQASAMLVPNRENEVFAPALLSMSQFSAEIVVASINGKDVFLDPGTRFCPYGLTDWRYSAVQGLRQREGKGTEIGEVPLSNYSQAMITRLARLKIGDSGRAEGTLGAAFYGLEAMELRQRGAKTDAEGKKQILEDEVKHWLPGESQVELQGTPAWEDIEGPLVTQFKISSPAIVSAGRRVLLPLHLFEFNNPAQFAAAQRVNGIYFYYPSRQIDEMHVTLPPTLVVENLPGDDLKKLDYAIYKSEQKSEGTNGIFARRELVMGGMAFPASVYPELKAFYDKVKADDDQQAILKQAENAAGN